MTCFHSLVLFQFDSKLSFATLYIMQVLTSHLLLIRLALTPKMLLILVRGIKFRFHVLKGKYLCLMNVKCCLNIELYLC